MTPQEKAKELVYKFIHHAESFNENHHAKQCALICVDEMINESEVLHRIKFLEQVEKEIKKL